MKQSPITGTIRTENAPPVTTAAPYSSSQQPGNTLNTCCWHNAAVSTAPASSGGIKLSNALRAALERSESASRFDFMRTATNAITSATIASPIQNASCVSGGRDQQSSPASTAEQPIATPPHPGTAVKEAARSIVSRINRKLSAARRSIETGSGIAPARCADAINPSIGHPRGTRQVLYIAKNWPLLAITLAALVPRLLLGLTQFVHYDGYWHVFIATQDRWSLFISEWKGDAHPPLHYLLLRALSAFGHSHLVYRLPSIVPGVASIYIFGRIAQKLCRGQLLALIAAAAYGFSITMIDLTCDVRSYPLALFSILSAFYCFLDASWALFGVLTALALLSEYYAAFFLLACIAILIVRCRDVKALCLALAPPLAVAAFLYRTHFRLQPRIENVVGDFYRQHGESIFRFVLTGLRNDLNFMLPFELHSTAALLAFLLLAAISVAFAWRRMTAAGRTAFVILLLMLAELAALGVARRYPFGGFARQQSLIFPFLVLAGFVLLDSLARNSKIVAILVAVSAAASFAYRWEEFPKVGDELFTPQYQAFSKMFARPEAVYVDQYSLIAYYIHTHDRAWTFEQHFHEPDRVDEYKIGGRLMLLRNLDQWNFDLLSPEFYRTLARSLASAGVQSADLFFLKQFPPNTADIESIRRLAAANGLTLGPIVRDNAAAFMEFRRTSNQQ